MAARQRHRGTLTKNKQKIQDEWAIKQMNMFGGRCPGNYKWYRVPGGYNCLGDLHKVTDELIQEGRLEYFVSVENRDVWRVSYLEWFGPYYWRQPKSSIVKYLVYVTGEEKFS